MIEEWKDIEGYEGIYKISNLGRVKSLSRINPQNKYQKEIIMKNRLNSNGYLTIKLMKNGKAKIKTLHRLVASAFIPNEYNLPCVNHIDEDRTNNNVENLEWCSYEYNDNYGNRNKKIAINNGHPIVAICPNGTQELYLSLSEASRILKKDGVGNICKALKGQLHSAYGRKWRYATEKEIKQAYELAGEKYE